MTFRSNEVKKELPIFIRRGERPRKTDFRAHDFRMIDFIYFKSQNQNLSDLKSEKIPEFDCFWVFKAT